MTIKKPSESEWLNCQDPEELVKFLRNSKFGPNRDVKERKLKAFVWRLQGFFSEAVGQQLMVCGPLNGEPYYRFIFRVLREILGVVGSSVAKKGGRDIRDSEIACQVARAKEIQAIILKDLFGNPFRQVPFIDPLWWAWNQGQVANLARAIDQEGSFKDLSILADALEDAGCDNTEILGHLRGPGPHVRGCWAFDLILGKS